MHVVLVGHTRHALREPFAGGLESLTWHLARTLVELGHRVSVYAKPGSDPIDGVEWLRTDPLELSDAARNDVSMPDPGWVERHHGYLQLMLQLARRTDVDIVHNHALHYLPVAMASTLPCPMVLTLHTPPTPALESGLLAARSAGLPGPFVTAVSAATARSWAHVVDATVVPNGIDTDRWQFGRGGDRLVWSGRIVPEKAPHVAVEIARAAGMPLVLAGPLADETYARERLFPLLGDGIDYAGHLPTPDLVELVGSSAAALVTPAWDEPYGLVAAEALSCGTPVVGMRRGGLPEVVPDSVGRLVRPGRDAVARAAAALPEALAIPRRRCREHALAECSLTVTARRYLEVYAAALAPVHAA